MEFWAYMVLEQGALSGKYDSAHPMPAGSMRAATYNPMLPAMGSLLGLMREIGSRHGVSPAQVAIGWAAARGVVPIIGVTREAQVKEAAAALDISLTGAEMAALEAAADASGVDTEAAWEKM